MSAMFGEDHLSFSLTVGILNLIRLHRLSVDIVKLCEDCTLPC